MPITKDEYKKAKKFAKFMFEFMEDFTKYSKNRYLLGLMVIMKQFIEESLDMYDRMVQEKMDEPDKNIILE